MQEKNQLKFMLRAIEMSAQGVEKGGGPFGAVIVRNGEIIAEAHNSVTLTNDPTAHAEINAIRIASRLLGKFDLSDCEIFTSCEPCPMCLAAIYWSKIPKVYYGNTYHDASAIGFSDKHIYEQIQLRKEERSILFSQLCRSEALEVFETWDKKTDKVRY